MFNANSEGQYTLSETSWVWEDEDESDLPNEGSYNFVDGTCEAEGCSSCTVCSDMMSIAVECAKPSSEYSPSPQPSSDSLNPDEKEKRHSWRGNGRDSYGDAKAKQLGGDGHTVSKPFGMDMDTGLNPSGGTGDVESQKGNIWENASSGCSEGFTGGLCHSFDFREITQSCPSSTTTEATPFATNSTTTDAATEEGSTTTATSDSTATPTGPEVVTTTEATAVDTTTTTTSTEGVTATEVPGTTTEAPTATKAAEVMAVAAATVAVGVVMVAVVDQRRSK